MSGQKGIGGGADYWSPEGEADWEKSLGRTSLGFSLKTFLMTSVWELHFPRYVSIAACQPDLRACYKYPLKMVLPNNVSWPVANHNNTTTNNNNIPAYACL
jgi:hypothetical protein